MVTDALTNENYDDIHYATFDGNRANLVAGFWEHKDKKSSVDVVKDNSSEKRRLEELFSSRKQIKSIDALSLETQQAISKQVAQKIESYDPER